MSDRRAGARAAPAPRRRNLLASLWRLFLLASIWLCGVAAYIIYVGERDQAADDDTRSDAIIVLGAAAYDARPSPVFEERIRHGIALYRRNVAPALIFTGGFGGTRARYSESQVARLYAVRQGVPDKAILIETVSRNTRENLTEAAKLMRTRAIRRAIVVSDPLHIARALRICDEIQIECLGSSTPTSRFRSLDTRWRFLLNEVYFFHRDLFARDKHDNP